MQSRNDIQNLGSEGEMIYNCDSDDSNTFFLDKFIIFTELDEHYSQ
jgi:hypothetical protein